MLDVLTPAVGLIFWQTVILLAACVLLRIFAWEPILGYIETEERHHTQALAATQAAQSQLELLNQKRKNILEQAEIEKKAIIDSALEREKQFLERAHREGKTRQEKMVKQAEATIAQAYEVARYQLRSEVASLAVGATQKLLGRELAPEHAKAAFLTNLVAEARSHSQD